MYYASLATDIDVAARRQPLEVVPVLEVVSDAPTPVSWPRRIWRGVSSAYDWLFGLAAIVAGLAALSTMPLVQFLTLGYLLEVGGRMMRTGQYSAGFIGIRQASLAGTV